MAKTALRAWAVEWHSKNVLDGEQRYLIWEADLRLFRSRRECRGFIEARYGYIRRRSDLYMREPHGWRMPKAVRVRVTRTR